MQEEVTQKTIAFSIKSAKVTAQVLQAAARKFLEARNKGKTKLHHGQQSLKQLKKHGAALSNIEITEANIGAFKSCAKKYGVDFALRKDKTTQPPHYVVIFKSKDADNLEQAFKEFAAKKLQKEQRPSIRQSLSALKEKAAARTARSSSWPMEAHTSVKTTSAPAAASWGVRTRENLKSGWLAANASTWGSGS